ncbi:hypothetical protein [Streptomyces sp. NPDC059928]|uniref:hypothetical protein n=1 Tax=unclassified Streptomyces TaxID=2593676 RepID=UPI00365CAD69
MSTMKRYLEDLNEVSAWAWGAAGLATPEARMTEFERLRFHSGDLASVYRQPVTAARKLETRAMETFIAAREVSS